MERNVLFNDPLKTSFIGYMVKGHSVSKRGKQLLPHGLFFPVSSKGSFIRTIGSLFFGGFIIIRKFYTKLFYFYLFLSFLKFIS